MKKFFKVAIKQAFEVFNYKISNIDEDDFVEETCTKRKKKDVFEKVSLKGEDIQIKIVIYIKKENDYYQYSSFIKLQRKFINFKELQKIWNASLHALKLFSKGYMSQSINKNMLNNMIDKAIEDSIIAQLINVKYFDYRVDCIGDILMALSKWSNRTYEGRKVPFSLIFNIHEINKETIKRFSDFLYDDASALLTDGITSYIAIGKEIEYKIVPNLDIEKKTADKVPLVPYRFSSFGNICNNKQVGIVLTVQGDVLFIKDKKLFYTKRNGNWYYYNYDSFSDTLFRDFDEMNSDTKVSAIKNIYLACLDVAFARTGGCLAVVYQNEVKNIQKIVPKEDYHKTRISDEYLDSKRYMLKAVVIKGRSFYDIERKSRQELLGIDGATIILSNGNFITTGSIIDNKIKDDFPKHGGARTQIAIKLSMYGIAIKISADGYIECYKNGKYIY